MGVADQCILFNLGRHGSPQCTRSLLRSELASHYFAYFTWHTSYQIPSNSPWGEKKCDLPGADIRRTLGGKHANAEQQYRQSVPTKTKCRARASTIMQIVGHLSGHLACSFCTRRHVIDYRAGASSMQKRITTGGVICRKPS